MRRRSDTASFAALGVAVVFGGAVCSGRCPAADGLAAQGDPGAWQCEDFPETLEAATEHLARIEYVPDRGLFGPSDDFQSPRRTLKRGKGDCDDTAILGAYYAAHLGYPAKILVLYVLGKCRHAVTLLEKHDGPRTTYGILDKTILIQPEHDSIDGAIVALNVRCSGWYQGYTLVDLDSLAVDWRRTDRCIRSFVSFSPYWSANTAAPPQVRVPAPAKCTRRTGLLHGRASLLPLGSVAGAFLFLGALYARERARLRGRRRRRRGPSVWSVVSQAGPVC